MTKTNAVLGRSDIIIWTVRGLCCLAARWVVLELPFLCEVLVGRFEARCKEAWQAFESLSRVAVVNCLPSNYSTHYASRGFSRKCADFKHGTRWTLCHTLASHLLPAVLSNSSTWIAPSFTFWHCLGQHKKVKGKNCFVWLRKGPYIPCFLLLSNIHKKKEHRNKLFIGAFRTTFCHSSTTTMHHVFMWGVHIPKCCRWKKEKNKANCCQGLSRNGSHYSSEQRHSIMFATLSSAPGNAGKFFFAISDQTTCGVPQRCVSLQACELRAS